MVVSRLKERMNGSPVLKMPPFRLPLFQSPLFPLPVLFAPVLESFFAMRDDRMEIKRGEIIYSQGRGGRSWVGTILFWKPSIEFSFHVFISKEEKCREGSASDTESHEEENDSPANKELNIWN